MKRDMLLAQMQFCNSAGFVHHLQKVFHSSSGQIGIERRAPLLKAIKNGFVRPEGFTDRLKPNSRHASWGIERSMSSNQSINFLKIRRDFKGYATIFLHIIPTHDGLMDVVLDLCLAPLSLMMLFSLMFRILNSTFTATFRNDRAKNFLQAGLLW